MDATAEQRRRIGEVFVELGFVTDEQLEAALAMQRRAGGRIGEILVEQGSLTRLDLASALAEHWEPRRADAGQRASFLLAGLGAQPAELQHAAGQRVEAVPATETGARRGLGQRRRSDVEAVVQERLEGLEERIAALQPLAAHVVELQRSLDELAAVHTAAAAVAARRLRGTEDRLAAVETRLSEAEEGLRRHAAATAGVEPRVAELERSLEQALGAARDEWLRSSAALGAEVVSLAARVDELQALRAADAQTARAGVERLTGLVGELGDRLEQQAALAEEQARATELAVREGLASLGKRLVGSDADYGKAGKGLRRSLDRLGAAIVEADARRAEQIPATPGEGFVAFVPTGEGYRLVAVAAVPPPAGDTIDLEGGRFVVSRYGCSPLPFDARPCAYLDVA